MYVFTQTYVSPEADRAKAKAQGGTNSPGPVYRLDVRSAALSAPACLTVYHQVERLSHQLHWTACRPNTHAGLQETLGRQFLSTRPSTGTMTFGTARREGMATNSAAPGPGQLAFDSIDSLQA